MQRLCLNPCLFMCCPCITIVVKNLNMSSVTAVLMGSFFLFLFFSLPQARKKKVINGHLARGRTDWNIKACSVKKRRKVVQKMRARLRMIVSEGERRGWMWTEHSWSPVCSFTHGYTTWWVERSRIQGAFNLPRAISEAAAFRKWLHWQESAAAVHPANFKDCPSIFRLIY